MATDDNRGRVITVFYVSYVVALGFGSFSIGLVDLDSHIPMAIAVALVTFAIIPVGLTRLRQPVPPEEVNVEIGKVWRISPVGLLGMLFFYLPLFSFFSLLLLVSLSFFLSINKCLVNDVMCTCTAS